MVLSALLRNVNLILSAKRNCWGRLQNDLGFKIFPWTPQGFKIPLWRSYGVEIPSWCREWMGIANILETGMLFSESAEDVCESCSGGHTERWLYLRDGAARINNTW